MDLRKLMAAGWGGRHAGSGEKNEVEGAIQSAEDATGIRGADSELSSSKELFRAQLEIETVGAIYFDMQGKLTDANDAFLKMSGYTRAELEAGELTWRRLTPSEHMGASDRAFAELKTRGVTTPYEKEYIRKDGSRWWALFAAKLLSDSTGFELVIDVTDRKLAEQRRLALVALSDCIRDADDPDELAFRAAEILGRTLNVSRAGYGTINTAAETITITRDWNAPGIQSLAGVLNFRDYGSYIEDLKRGETVVFSDAETDPRTAATADALKAISARSIVNMPVTEQGGFVALLYLNHATARSWPDEELAFIREFADRTRTAVERLRAEADLRLSEAELRQLNENLEAQVRARTAERNRVWEMSRDLLAIMGFDGHLKAINPAWEATLGQSTERLLSLSFREQVHSDDHPAVLTVIERLLAGETVERFEDRLRHADGSWRWISWTLVPGGDVFYAVGRDVTGEKDRETLLRRYHDIIEATVAPICAFDTEYRLIAFNKAHNDEFRRVNGFDTKIGDVFPDLFIPEQQPVMRALMSRALTGEAFTVREEFGRPELGTPVWEISYTPLRDDDGKVIGAFHHATDISPQLVAEAELETAQEALRQSQKMEAIGQLTGGVAHDFNNLLTPIVGSLDMLVRKGLGSEREQRLIDGALQSADRAKTLVQRLLAFARRQPLQPTAVDVPRLVEGMVGLIGSTVGPSIDMVVDIDGDLPSARADHNQLEMALLNLAVNARDAMPDGGRLRISAARATVGRGGATGLRAGDYLRLDVADDGLGMDEATLSRATEPFFSTKGIGKGTGLGLSMVHGLAAQLGGGLTIDSTPGLGTTVSMWLPISAEPAQTGDKAVEGPVRFSRGTALLVDDQELVRMSTADMLIDLGFQVVEAGSAEEALNTVAGGLAPDVLITDHLMPGMSGADLVRAMRSLQPALPVLVVSGYAEAEGIDPSLPRLTKPFRNAELAASLAALMPVAWA